VRQNDSLFALFGISVSKGALQTGKTRFRLPKTGFFIRQKRIKQETSGKNRKKCDVFNETPMFSR
jgi:hypothetical protein